MSNIFKSSLMANLQRRCPLPGRYSHKLMASVAITMACSIVAGVSWFFYRPAKSPEASPRSILIEALEFNRPIEGRLVDMAYMPYRRPLPKDLPRIRKAARQLRKRGLANLNDLVFLKIAAQDLDGAIHILQSESSSASANPGILSDLSAVYLARASDQRFSRPKDLIYSLSTIASLRSNGILSNEILFNEAIVLSRLSLRSSAMQAWQNYLQVEEDPRWKKEAERHLNDVSRPSDLVLWKSDKETLERTILQGDTQRAAGIVARFPQFARIYAEECLLGVWATSVKAGKHDEAKNALTIARVIGDVLAGLTYDYMVRDSVRAIDHALEKRGRVLDDLIGGHLLFVVGLERERSDDFGNALPPFRESATLLRKAGSPFYHWAVLHAGFCEHFVANYEAALAAYSQVRSSRMSSRYPALIGRSLWLTGLAHFVTGDLPRALNGFLQSQAQFVAVKELVHARYLDAMIAASLYFLGDKDLAWRHRHRSLTALADLEDPRRVYSILWEVAQALLEDKQPRVSLVFLKELIRGGSLDKVPGVKAEILLRLARIENQVGNRSTALLDVREAKNALKKVLDPRFRDRIEADIFRSDGELKLLNSPELAIDRFTQALAIFSKNGYPIESAEVLKLRALAHRRAGELDLAESDLEAGIEEYESGRVRLPSEAMRLQYFERVRQITEELVELQLTMGRPAETLLQTSERTKARSLQEILYTNVRPGKLVDPRRLRGELSEEVTVIEYFLLNNTLIILVCDRDSIELETRNISASIIAEWVSSLRGDLASGNHRAIRTAGNMYTLLIAPIEERLKGKPRLLIIPDKSLYELPFAALYNRGSGRFLVEDYTISTYPSFSAYLKLLANRENQGKAPNRVLVAANSTGNPVLFPHLPRLPGVLLEADSIYRLYPEVEILGDQEATVRGFEAKVGKGFRIIHIAGHTISDARYPFSSAIILRPEGNDDGILSAEELYRQHFAGTQLVVLSSCGTALGGVPTSEGILNLARPFLAAGVPQVLATLWNINDREGARFFSSFYRRLASTADVSLALADVQRELIRENRKSRKFTSDWAAVQLMGIN